MLRNFIFVSSIACLFTQCNNAEETVNTSNPLLQRSTSQSANPVEGEWKYSSSIWYSSELSLHSNGTFTFHDQSCIGQRFSQGHWTNSMGIIVLQSLESFRDEKQTDGTDKRKEDVSAKANPQLKQARITFSRIEISRDDFPAFF